MFGVTQEKLFRGLSALSDCHCGYTRRDDVRKEPATQPHRRCDCKYGFAEKLGQGSEQNGCPEAEMAARLVLAMTSTEFWRICRRAGVHVTGLAPPPRPKKRKPPASPQRDPKGVDRG